MSFKDILVQKPQQFKIIEIARCMCSRKKMLQKTKLALTFIVKFRFLPDIFNRVFQHFQNKYFVRDLWPPASYVVMKKSVIYD